MSHYAKLNCCSCGQCGADVDGGGGGGLLYYLIKIYLVNYNATEFLLLN